MKWPDGTPKSSNNAFTGAVQLPETETDRREAAMQTVAVKRRKRGQYASFEKLTAEAILKARHGGVYTTAISSRQRDERTYRQQSDSI